MHYSNKPKLSALTLALVTSLGLSAALLTQTASAIQLSHVEDDVTGSGSSWQYDFTVFNDSVAEYGGALDVIIDWELPFFNDMGITNVQSPSGWDFAIETIGTPNAATGWEGVAAWNDPSDPWYILLDGDTNPIFDATQVLHWYCVDPMIFQGEGGECFDGAEGFGSPIFPGDSLSGFGFDAAFAPVNAPYQTSWAVLPVNTGDPAFPGGVTVASPSALVTNNIPEPGTLALMSFGLAGFAGAASTFPPFCCAMLVFIV